LEVCRTVVPDLIRDRWPGRDHVAVSSCEVASKVLPAVPDQVRDDGGF